MRLSKKELLEFLDNIQERDEDSRIEALTNLRFKQEKGLVGTR